MGQFSKRALWVTVTFSVLSLFLLFASKPENIWGHYCQDVNFASFVFGYIGQGLAELPLFVKYS